MSGRRGLAVAGAHGKSTTSAMLRRRPGRRLGLRRRDRGRRRRHRRGLGRRPLVRGRGRRERPLAAAPAPGGGDPDQRRARPPRDLRQPGRGRGGLPRVPRPRCRPSGLAVDRARPRRPRLRAAPPAAPVRLVGPAPGAWGVAASRPRAGRAPGSPWPWPTGAGCRSRWPCPARTTSTNAACALALAEWCGVPLEAAAERLAAFPAWGAGSSSAARPAGCGWSTTTPTTPPRCGPPCRRARGPPRAGVVAVFQPHLYSRTRALAGELGRGARARADLVVVTDVYPAREAPVPGVSGRLVADAVPRPPGAAVRADPGRRRRARSREPPARATWC